MAEAPDLVLTLFPLSKCSITPNFSSICSVTVTVDNDTDASCSFRRHCSKMYTKFTHCKTSSSFRGFEDPNRRLRTWERTKRFLQLLSQSHPTTATIGSWETQFT